MSTLLHINGKNLPDFTINICYFITKLNFKTRSSAIAEGLHEALVSRNPATIKHLTWKTYGVALFAWFYV